MSDRLQDIHSSRGTSQECSDCDEQSQCDHHWLLDEVHRVRDAVTSHRERSKRLHKSGTRDVHEIDDELWAGVMGRGGI